MEYNEATIKKLAGILKWLKEKRYSAAILLGAGVSVSAGIPTANGIIKDIKQVFPFTKEEVKSENYPAYMGALPAGIRKEFIKDYIRKSKVNISHLYLGALVKEHYIDRILTTNFDPLIIRALALYNIFPAVYDFAASSEFVSGGVADPSIFYLHGQSDGFVILNTDEEVNSLSEKVKDIFNDTAIKRCWIIIGYSGKNDPVFKILADLNNIEYGLFWIGYNGEEPPSHVERYILTEGVQSQKRKPKDGMHYIKEVEDSDTFFIKLAKELNIPEPKIISRPFSHLKESLEAISDIRKEDKVTNITQKAIRDIKNAINIFESEQIMDKVDLLQKTREILVFEKYNEIENIYDNVKKSNILEAKDNLADALNNYRIELENYPKNRDDKNSTKKIKIIMEMEKQLRTHGTNKCYKTESDFISPRSRYFVDINKSDKSLNEAGLKDAAVIFNCSTDDVHLSSFKVYNRDLLECYIHRIYVRKVDFMLIEEDYKKDKTINIIKSILQKKGASLYYKKSHQFIPTFVGYDSLILGNDFNSPAMLHVQVSYIEKSKEYLEPIELLISKYQNPINISGFIIDKETRERDYFSKAAELNLKKERYRKLVKTDSYKFYIPFTNINACILKFTK